METKEEILNELNALDGSSDNEGAHSYADALLLNALELAGMSDVVTAYKAAANRVTFWYA